MKKPRSCSPLFPHEIIFLSEPITLNAINEVDKSSEWTAFLSIYGKIETSGGREVWKASQVHSEVTVVITCPWSPSSCTINADNKVRFQRKDYDILFAENVDELNKLMRFGCKRTDT